MHSSKSILIFKVVVALAVYGGLGMRIWSLHPSLLDSKGLVAAWREALGAQAVLAGTTKGYSKHPQLTRFYNATEPLAAVGYYLCELASEAGRRGYTFNESKIVLPCRRPGHITVTDGQLQYELDWLRSKVTVRSPSFLPNIPSMPVPHDLFKVVPGEVENWERIKEI